MSVTSESSTVTSPIVEEEELWGTKGIYIGSASSFTEISWPRLPLAMSPPPGLPVPLRLLAALHLKRARTSRPNVKPKGPRPQPRKHIAKPLKLQITHSSNHHEPSVSAPCSPHRARGIYGDCPRLPTHRPSRYIPEYICDGDRFAHLAPFRNQETVIVDQHACVSHATMGLERLNMRDEDEYMDLQQEAELFRSLDVAVQEPSLPLSCSSVQLGFVINGLRGALSNFRARFGPGPGAAGEGSEGREPGVEILVEGGFVDIKRDEVCLD